MSELFTEGVLRVLQAGRRRALGANRGQVEPVDVLAGLADDEESRASVLLRRHGLDPAEVAGLLGVAAPSEASAEQVEAIPNAPDTRALLHDATSLARSVDRSRPVATEHLLAALLTPEYPFREPLQRAGLRLDGLLGEMVEMVAVPSDPLPLPSDISPLELVTASEAVDLGRVLDASANRAREGLRVIEDYVRFALNDPMLTRRLKAVRHRLDEAIRGLDPDLLLDSRDAEGDVGAHVMAPLESTRESPRAVLAANFKRAQEALRSLEEYTKLVDAWIAGRFEVARYDLYTLEKLVMTAVGAVRTFDAVRLYVLVGGLPTLGDLTWIVGEALAGGAGAIQLREKGIDDREYLTRAREVRILTAKAGARFILNDRPDLARLAGADGVHIGQEDLQVRDARRVVGPRGMIGVSTHERSQIERAVIDGAGYLGVGPVFPSGTKEFRDHVGLGLVREASETTELPWFAIGGIDESNIAEVVEAGATRVAVSGAVVRAESPRAATKALRAALDAV